MTCRLRYVVLWTLMALSLACHAQPLIVYADTAGTAMLEGVYRMTDSGAVFSIAPMPAINEDYALTLLWSPDLSVPSGTPFGTMRPAGQPFVFDATMGIDHRGGRNIAGTKKFRFRLEFSTDGRRISFKPYKRSWRVNLMRIMPYLFRTSISKTDTRPDDIDGAVRIDASPVTFITEL